MFSHNGKIYRYASFVPNCEDLKAKVAATTRGKTLINIAILERDSKSGKILMQTLT
jgi:hypothetical protein